MPDGRGTVAALARVGSAQSGNFIQAAHELLVSHCLVMTMLMVIGLGGDLLLS
jgi:hypothetical protein